MPSEMLSGLLATHPGLIDALAAVYLIGSFVGHVMRAGWPDEADRPRHIRILMAVADAMQLVFFAEVKNLARKA